VYAVHFEFQGTACADSSRAACDGQIKVHCVLFQSLCGLNMNSRITERFLQCCFYLKLNVDLWLFYHLTDHMADHHGRV